MGKVKSVSNHNPEDGIVEATVINSLDEDISTFIVVVNPQVLLPGEEAAFSLKILVAVEQGLRLSVKAVRIKEQLEVERLWTWI